MKSAVYFMDLRTTIKENLLNKLGRLLETADFNDSYAPRDLVAVKLHFGELGNTAYIRPVFLSKIVEMIKTSGGNPFLTDANTLYSGTRSDSPTHLKTAVKNGFTYSVLDAPVIIADGLRGRSETAVRIDGNRFDEVFIGSEIIEADAMISVAHFKGHELSGFGGAIKNVGMGCASRRGKMAQHSDVSPKVKRKKCVGCEDCIGKCSQNAISMQDEKAVIDKEKCIGCGECILVCPNGAIQIMWRQSIPVFLEAMAEYTFGVLKDKMDKSFFINFITNISPACDCLPNNDAAIVRDIGILASKDPVAIDQASVDLVNKEPGLSGSCLDEKDLSPGSDKFRAVYPNVDWNIQLDFAQKMGLGSRDYEMIKI
ncbi:DUF362 domain-containing protein [Desulfobacterales bacterium HSG16]|nr:DUF362 domain-containing protein [Desulfobacterales bacterium HSG16]